ncbi:M43 family zinc metalloprotease [Shivajiella indica]|uniref:M43 family zinc metalloprotease n=1 Tax=Shivajiella indica TaxID=872115 RepID=A0ABW5B4X4_9BACT
MKNVIFLSVFVVLLIFNSCITDNEVENSFYLNQVEKIELSIENKFLIADNNIEKLKLTFKFLDNGNRAILTDTKLELPLQIYLGDSIIESSLLDLSKTGKYKVRAFLPSREGIFSNAIEVEVVDPSIISNLVLDFSDETRNEYAVAKNGTFDFTITAYGENGEIPDIKDQILRNLELQIGNSKINKLEDIQIEEIGILKVQATAFGIKSNILRINSRKEKAFPIKEFQVIFHVFVEGTDISSSEIEKQIMQANMAFGGGVNTNFKRNMNAVNVNFRFKAANRDPEGNFLTISGYNKVSKKLLQNELGQNWWTKFVELWNPTEYINVFIDDGLTVLGVMGSAFTPVLKDAVLGGLQSNPELIELNFPYSISLAPEALDDEYFSRFIFAHELGHYFGLHHTFLGCSDGDYIEDTRAHTDYLGSNLRFDCKGQGFISTNFMDYIVTPDNFTFDQRDRMNIVYDNAHFMPRDLKSPTGRLKNFKKGKLDHSIRPIVCYSRFNQMN